MTITDRVDLRATSRWRDVMAHFEDVAVTGPHDALDLRDPTISSDGRYLAAVATRRLDLDGDEATVVVLHDTVDDRTEVISGTWRAARIPRWAPAGGQVGADALALVTDGPDGDGGVTIVRSGDHLVLPVVGGVIESLSWSPRGDALLAVVAEHGADAAGAAGSGRLVSPGRPDWLPHVLADVPVSGWRRAFVHRLGEDGWQQASRSTTTTWEACWVGDTRIASIRSDRPDEAAWFEAVWTVSSVEDPEDEQVLARNDHRCLGLPAASPDGRWVAAVRAVCSDRTVVAGELLLAELGADGFEAANPVEVGGVDVTCLSAATASRLVAAGQRGLATVVVDLDVGSRATTERWSSVELSCGQRYPAVVAAPTGRVALVAEGFGRPPEFAVSDPTDPEPTVCTDVAPSSLGAIARRAGELRAVEWTAPDGLRLEGLVVTPPGPGPHPLVTYVHGGPIWAWRSRWSMGYPYTLLLARSGIAVFHPNPRGSSGRGEAFASAVLGDMGGAECGDLLSGIEHLVQLGIADDRRVGVLGGSHGGFMAARLVTVTDRFAACVSYSPVTHWPTMRLTTNDIAAQDRLLGLDGAPSPLDDAAMVTTPTLVLAGSHDLITPPAQAKAFHRALVLAGVPTAYAEYPCEGHGVRSFPAQIDFSARVLDWFETWFARAVT